VPVVSSAVVSVGYRAVDRVLEIEFQGGRVYQYAGVRPWEYERLMDSTSLGRYVNAKIKPFYEGIPVEK
jgi:hypothetical protein